MIRLLNVSTVISCVKCRQFCTWRVSNNFFSYVKKYIKSVLKANFADQHKETNRRVIKWYSLNLKFELN